MMSFSALLQILFQIERTSAYLLSTHIFAVKRRLGDTCFALFFSMKPKCADCENEWNGYG